MKKTLLLLGAALSATAALAAEPVIYKGVAILQFSPNGRYAVSSYGDGNIEIFDFETDERIPFFAGEDGISPFYGNGLGNCISNNGILVGSNEQNNAAYYYNGEWKTLSVPSADESFIHSPNGITPDGSRICGNIGSAAFSLESSTMSLPAIWNRNADGTYGEYVELPHPDKDLFGETPMYITAIAISDDGKTVAGQLVSNTGFFQEPILYTEDADGKWSYTLPLHHLYNPDHLEILPGPGEAPESPDMDSYMTAEELAKYDAALKAWQEESEETGNWDYTKYPEKENFMSEEGKANYDKAMAEYNAKYAEWEEKFSAYQNRMFEIIEASPNFVFNNVLLSGDGKTMGGTLEKEDPNPTGGWGPAPMLNIPAIVNLETKEITEITAYGSLEATYLVDGGMLASTGLRAEATVAYILKNDGTAQSLYDYLSAKSPELASWCKENFVHSLEVYDPETDDFVVKEMTLTGLPVATADMGIIASYTMAVWEDYEAWTYFFDMSKLSGVENVAAGNKTAVKAAGGILYVDGSVVSLEVYNLAGKLVRSLANPGNAVDMQLEHGVYVVKATCADGSVVNTKLAL